MLVVYAPLRYMLICMATQCETVGILNVTTNSFSDGGQYLTEDRRLYISRLLDDARLMVTAGARYLDVGAEATNPFAEPLDSSSEWRTLQQILPTLFQEFEGRLSLDTMHADTAHKALSMGDLVLNDVMTFRDPALVEVAKHYKPICIVSHAPMEAHTMKEVHDIKLDSKQQVIDELMQQVEMLIKAGIPPVSIIIDPGIGFGKTMRLNWELLKIAADLPDQAVMIGHSRKRFLAHDETTGEPLYTTEEQKKALQFSDERNRHAAAIAIKSHARFIRVHEPALYKDLLAA